MIRRNKGFTLIELMIVVAIIGILASLAVSAYQTYVVRAQVVEGINLASALQTPDVESFDITGEPPADRAAAGMGPATETQGTYVSQVDIVDGRIEITYGNDAHQDIFGQTVSITPYSLGGSWIWRCGAAPAPAGAVPMTGNGVVSQYVAPTVDTRYLPGACRN